MKSDERKLEKLGLILKSLPKEKLDQEFDRRFWGRFETEKNRRIPFGTGMPAPVLVGVVFFFATLLVTSAVVLVGSSKDRPQVQVIQGQNIHLDEKNMAQTLHPGGLVKDDHQIRTGEGSWAILELKKGYQIKIHPNSVLRLQQSKPTWLQGQTVFHLTKGQVLVTIDPDRKYPLEIHTPHAFAEAVGTQFMVSANTSGSPLSMIRVLNGEVGVGAMKDNQKWVDSRIALKAGYETTVTADADLSSPVHLVESKLEEMRELFQFSRPNHFILLIGMSRERTRELLRPCAIYIRYAVKDKMAPEMIRIVQNIQEASENKNAAQHLDSVRQLEQIAERHEEANRMALLLFTGAYYAYLGEHADAVRVFERTASENPQSMFRSMALLAAAIIYQEDLRNPSKASELAQEILNDYPTSFESSEAKALLDLNPTGA